ncbi:UNVERIFIED_CONTAM: hypothetical protein FKN15_075304 [Acipenser sinensis]
MGRRSREGKRRNGQFQSLKEEAGFWCLTCTKLGQNTMRCPFRHLLKRGIGEAGSPSKSLVSNKRPPSDEEQATPGDGKQVTPGDREQVTPGDGEQASPDDGEHATPGEAKLASPGGDDLVTPCDGDHEPLGDNQKASPGDCEQASPGGAGRAAPSLLRSTTPSSLARGQGTVPPSHRPLLAEVGPAAHLPLVAEAGAAVSLWWRQQQQVVSL